MVDHTIKDKNTSVKAISGSKSGVRKYTLSCSRCRASKLKCDTKEPCLECVKRNVGHLCTKDERQPRAKRAKTDYNSNSSSNTETNASQNQATEAEEAAKILEHFVDETSRTNVYIPAVLGPTSSFVAPDYPNTYWSTTSDPQRQAEKMALIREVVDAIPEPDMVYLLYEVFITRCQGPLGNVVHTPTFMKQAGKLCGCLGLASPEAQVIALSNTICMDALACHLLALVLGLAFHPIPSLYGWSSTPLTLRVEEIRASDVHSKTWRSLALRCLRGRVSLFCGSIAALQAGTMLLLDGQEGSLTLDGILVTAISGAQKLGLHRLGDAKLEVSASPSSASEDALLTLTEPPHVRTEIGIRIWWALVMRDWSRGQALGYYSVHPSQSNTRMPLHLNDDDLSVPTLKVNVHGDITERPRSEFTMLSYTVHALKIAVFARESIDLRGPLRQTQGRETNGDEKMRNHLNKEYENFVAGLPSHFRLGSTVGLTSTGPMAAIPVQRWMLHQQLWGILLGLHRASLSSQDNRASCQLLAQNIISTQAQIQVRCTVCGSLSTSETQLFSAATVLLLDLLFSSQHKDADRSSAQLSRLITRDKIREAIELLRERAKASARRSVTALEALLELEEEESGKSERSSRASWTRNSVGGQGLRSDGSPRILLKHKVMGIMDALQRDAKHATAAVEQANFDSSSVLDMSMPLPTAIDGFQDLDVLPVLSNDPSFNLWQFMDFGPPPQSPTENNSFSASAGSQNVVGSMPFMPSSSVVHSLSSLDALDFADTDGTRDTYPSPLSFESGPTKLNGGSEAAMTLSNTDTYVANNLW